MLLSGGRVVCPLGGIDEFLDVRIDDGHVVEIGPKLAAGEGPVIDCSGAVIGPGLVDLGTELADPGMTWREDLITGSEAGAAGGFTTLLASPATDPVMDCPSLVREVLARSAGLGGARVLQAGALTMGLEGQTLAEVGLLGKAGCVAISDGGRVISDSAVLRRAMDYLRPFGIPILLRPGEEALSANGSMNEGSVSIRVGLRGEPAAAEEIGITRILSLASLTGARVHISHVTTAGGLALVEKAKSEGLRITASCPARNLLLSDRSIETVGYDTSLRLEPPLRSPADNEALKKGLISGVLDALIADHKPWTRVEKEIEFEWCTPGAMGLETALGAALQGLDGDLRTTLQTLSVAPAAVLGRRATVEVGSVADLVIFEPDSRTIAGPQWRSRGINEPLAGRELPGRIRATLVEGRVVFAQH
jgi:dihydroorotase